MSYYYLTMKKELTIQLRGKLGSHTAVARAIGLDPRTYRRQRSGGKLPVRTEKSLELLAEKLTLTTA